MRLAAAIAAVAFFAPALATAQDTPASVVEGDAAFEMKVLATGLDWPWEVTWGPDDHLWVTERVGRKIVRVDPQTGDTKVAIAFDDALAPGGQDGLMGLALHPELLQGTGNDYVYTAYTYKDESQGPDRTVPDPFSPYRFLYTKIVRLTYDPATETLGEPVELITGLPAHNDHNSGRMKIGPDGKLYYTIGDGGKNQLGNWCLPIEAQRIPTAQEIAASDWLAYQGKSLRLALDGSIPADNPEIEGVRSHVFTYGHRNMQGIDFAEDGTLYASEHGPKADDEVNILFSGGNYGWPHVSGYRDDKAYQYARWAEATTPCSELQFSDIEIDPSVPRTPETEWDGEMVDPLATMFTVPSDWNFSEPICRGIDFICWPTVAPSSIEVYEGDGVPEWGKSLLVTTLKRGSLYRVPLSEDGRSVAGPIERYFQSENRFRDLAVGPDGRTLYVATDNSGLAEQIGGGTTTRLQDPGSILVFTYTGKAAAQAESADAGTEETAPEDSTAMASGATLPVTFTANQVESGRAAYNTNCVSCHGQNLINATYGTPLAGPYFDDKWRGQTVGDFYAYSHDRMPPSRPGTLPDETYADIVAYVLSVNDFAAGQTPLPTDQATLQQMVITAK